MGSAAAPWEKYSQSTEESGPWQKYGTPAKAEEKSAAPNQGLPEGELPLDSYTNATLQGLSTIGKGAIGAVQGIAYNTIAHPIDTAKSILSLPSQARQVPGAIKDINASADPVGTYAKVAGDTAGEAAGQAIVGAAGEQAPGFAKDAIEGIGPKSKALARQGRGTVRGFKGTYRRRVRETSVLWRCAQRNSCEIPRDRAGRRRICNPRPLNYRKKTALPPQEPALRTGPC